MSNSAVYSKRQLFGFPYNGKDAMYFFLQKSLKPREKVIVCFSPNDPAEDRAELLGAVEAWGAEPVIWDEDLRWKTLLRMTFDSRAETIIGSAKSILSLAKLAKINRIPLCIYNAVVIGMEASEWMLDGIANILDCRVFRCPSPTDQVIEWMPSAYNTGKPANNLETVPGNVKSIRDYLMHWGSILDCDVYRTVGGLAMEIVCFRGEKLPTLPSCAKLVLRNWNPDFDVPICTDYRDRLSETH